MYPIQIILSRFSYFLYRNITSCLVGKSVLCVTETQIRFKDYGQVAKRSRVGGYALEKPEEWAGD